MASINISTITFIPGMEFTFRSFNFIAGTDGRLRVSNLEMARTGRIGSDSASHIITHPESESDSARSENRIMLPRHLSRADDIILPTDDEFRVINVITHSLGQHDHGEGSLHRVSTR